MSSRLPTFVIIGAAKSATSSLRVLLGGQPNVFLAQDGVETKFFAEDETYAKGIDWYASLFAGAKDTAVLGECSNIYAERDRFPDAAKRIAQHLPDAKLIYIVRDPLPRIASFWIQLRSHGGEDVHHDFATALRRDRTLLIDSSNYWRQLELYRSLFPDSQIKILFFEDFATNPVSVMTETCRFIGVDPPIEVDLAAAHQNRSSGKVGAPPWLSRLRRSAVFRSARRMVPGLLRKRIRKRLLFREISPPEWTPELRNWVLGQLRADSLRLLDYCDRPANLWTLE